MPGSHLAGRLPTPAESTDHTVATAIPLEAPKGSCVVYDARLWHGTGVNDGSIVDKPTGLPWRLGIFTLYCAPWARPQENMTLGALPEVVETLTEHQKTLLGLRPWYAPSFSDRSQRGLTIVHAQVCLRANRGRGAAGCGGWRGHHAQAGARVGERRGGSAAPPNLAATMKQACVVVRTSQTFGSRIRCTAALGISSPSCGAAAYRPSSPPVCQNRMRFPRHLSGSFRASSQN